MSGSEFSLFHTSPVFITLLPLPIVGKEVNFLDVGMEVEIREWR